MRYDDAIDLEAEIVIGQLAAAAKRGGDAIHEAVRAALLRSFEAGRRSVLGDPSDGNDEDDEKPRG